MSRGLTGAWSMVGNSTNQCIDLAPVVRVDAQPVTSADWATAPLATTVQNGQVDGKFFSVDISKIPEAKEQKPTSAGAAVRRMFSRVASPNLPKPHRYRALHLSQAFNTSQNNGTTADVVRIPGRPSSMEFLDLCRTDLSERSYLLPSDASHLGLALKELEAPKQHFVQHALWMALINSHFHACAHYLVLPAAILRFAAVPPYPQTKP
ncbi:unnamed protein product [Dibothriocephalus latus]|uniref:Uncharacterized protein n=1 Tax=Dibothriocephalus latus TaxID=60516 RepID=A0A3P7MFE9_DIBLA|nr:unnamed protein product [Dibothriocephalus latus]